MPQLINFYKITSPNTPKVYVGSTVKPLEERLLRHTLDYVNYNNGYGNRTTSHEILIFNNYSIHLLETALCLTKDDRNTIEQKLGKKIKFIHTFHGHLFDDPEFKGFKAIIISAIEKFLSKKSDRLITVGENVKRDLESRRIKGKRRTIPISPAVIPLKLISKESALKKFKVRDKKRFRVLWMARVTGVKDPQKVIAIAQSLPEIDFYMAGGGDLLEEIKINAPKNLKVLSWQDAKEVLPIADIFLSTSKNEGIPIAMIEAQLAGIPIVATDVGSVSEVVLNNKTGILCDRSEKLLIEGIKELALDKRLRSTFSKNAKSMALKKQTLAESIEF